MAPAPDEIRVDAGLVTSKESRAAIRETLSELLFILLPFVVLGLVFRYSNSGIKMLWHPELSIASTLLFGHAIVKFVCGVARFEHRGLAALVTTLGIVLGLAPPLTVLVLVQLLEESHKAPEQWLVVVQGLLLLGGLIYFVLFRWLGGLAELIERTSSVSKQ
jgi:hypothetical protein